MSKRKNSRAKGKRGELEAAKALTEVLGIEFRRGQQYSGIGGADVVGELAGVHFEVKRTETLSIYEALAQATRDAGYNVPVVLHKRNNKPWIAVIDLGDLPALATQVYLTKAGQ